MSNRLIHIIRILFGLKFLIAVLFLKLNVMAFRTTVNDILKYFD